MSVEIKLSKKQKEVVEAMRKGVHIVKMNTFEGSAYLSDNSFSHLNLNTFCALYSKGLIKSTGRDFPSENYYLTELGKKTKLN